MKYPSFTREQNLACKLSDEDIACIRREFDGGETKAFLARKFKVSEPAIRYWVAEKFRQAQLKRKHNGHCRTAEARRKTYYRKMEMYEKSFKLWIAQERKRLYPRYADNLKKYQKKYYLENIDKIKIRNKKNEKSKSVYMKEYRNKNKDVLFAYLKRWRQENRDKTREYSKSWAKNNKEWMRAFQKEYYKKYKNVRKANRNENTLQA